MAVSVAALWVVSFKAKRSFVGACAAFLLWLWFGPGIALAAGAGIESGIPTAQATPRPAATARTLLVLGDSLSAGYGIDLKDGWVALLQKRLEDQGYGYRVVNASVSGETTTGGLQRLPRALAVHKPEIVVVELGGNDGLRGLPLDTTRDNLTRITELSQAAGAKVLLLGMKMPPNYGPKYTQGFEQLFAELAIRKKLAFVPFFLERVALKPGLIQADGIHPTAPAQPLMLESVWPTLQKQLLRR